MSTDYRQLKLFTLSVMAAARPEEQKPEVCKTHAHGETPSYPPVSSRFPPKQAWMVSTAVYWNYTELRLRTLSKAEMYTKSVKTIMDMQAKDTLNI